MSQTWKNIGKKFKVFLLKNLTIFTRMSITLECLLLPWFRVKSFDTIIENTSHWTLTVCFCVQKEHRKEKKWTQPKTNNWRILIKRSVNLLKEFQRRIDTIILILSSFFVSFLRFLWKITTLWAYQMSKYNFFRSNFKSKKPHCAFFYVLCYVFSVALNSLQRNGCECKYTYNRLYLYLYIHIWNE